MTETDAAAPNVVFGGTGHYERGLSEDSLAKVLGGTAAAFYGLDLAVEPRD